MRFGASVALLVAALATARCGGGGLIRQYEYEEDVYLSLDGTATVYVNTSIAALDRLRGVAFDAGPNRPVDRDAIRRYFTTAVTEVTRVTTSRRNNRWFVHVRLEVGDLSRLGEARPFAWSVYRFNRDVNAFEYRQTVGAAAEAGVTTARWTGDELVAFRLRPPSKIDSHNAFAVHQRRGNIIVWEQPLSDRLRGVPLVLEARMQTQSILYRTLWLFAATFGAVAFTFVIVIWWVFRRRAETAQT